MIKIYGTGHTRWTKCIWMAREVGAEFEAVEVSYDQVGGHFGDAEFLKTQPFGLVPAMEHGDLKLFESQAIINYLGETHPEAQMIPEPGTAQKALYDQWVFFTVTTLETPLWSWFRHAILFGEEKKSKTEISRAYKELQSVLGKLDPLLEGVDYLVGDRFTAADITLCFNLNWASTFKFLDKHENLKRYLELHKQRKAYPSDLNG